MRAWTSVDYFEIKPITTQLPLFACGQRHGACDEGTEGGCQTISTRLLRPPGIHQRLRLSVHCVVGQLEMIVKMRLCI